MLFLSLLLATVAPPQTADIEMEATRCGLTADQLTWTVDASGHKRAQINPHGNWDSLAFTSVRCLLDWASKTGANVGFISEPPPPKPSAADVRRIERECQLKAGTLTVEGEHVRLRPAPDEDYERVDCALGRLRKAGLGERLGFVGNEADPNAVLRPPLRYIAVGSAAQMAALRKAAEVDRWTIDRTATSSDGTVILQFETGATMTNGQAESLLNRIWKNEFGDISLGMAPRKLSSRDQVDE
jgi:hypothetical protein